ncbi:MAG: DUF2284 domain-containing protein [Mogibacterium sp.]|nr:DUF2284 domain-containing protein [Mogibacterium sp.]
MILNEHTDISIQDLLQLAREIGFSHAAPLDPQALVFREEVRAMCSADRCRNYGRSWSCPPALGSLRQIAETAAEYAGGILVQTTEPMEDDFDLKTIHEAAKLHQQHFDTLVRQVGRLCPDCLPMGAGGCRRCRKCTYPDRPCRHPDKLYPSMEAYGLLVSDICIRSGLKYNYGPQTMTYTSCILVRETGAGCEE